MTLKEAAERVLREAGTPLHYTELTNRILALNLWSTSGKTPQNTLYRELIGEMQKHGANSKFVRPAPGLFALREGARITDASAVGGIVPAATWQSPTAEAATLGDPSSEEGGESGEMMAEADISAMTGAQAPTAPQPTTVLQAARIVLEEAGQPLDYYELTNRILERKLWQPGGKTPAATVNASLAVDIKQRGSQSPFQRTAKGVFALRSWGLPELVLKSGEGHSTAVQPATGATAAGTDGDAAPGLSFTDAAEQILIRFAKRKPMHYGAVTDKALDLGLINTEGQTPEATLYAAVLNEIERQSKRGDRPRFVKHGQGLLGLSEWSPGGLERQIEDHNSDVRKRLHQQLLSMPPGDFEALVGRLLVALGFEEVEQTSISKDGGIDVRGTLVVGDVIRTRMAVQVKRWKNNVQAPVVQQVRGSLGTHEQGLIITTSDFSDGARKEAQRQNAVPVALMDGEQLVSLLVEHSIGVNRQPHILLELGTLASE